MRELHLLRLSLAFGTLLLIASGAAAQPGAHLQIVTDDTEVATMQLIRHLAEHGFSIGHREGSLFFVQRDQLQLVFDLEVSSDTLDRIVITRAFALKEGTSTEEMNPIVLKLNNVTSGIQYSVTSGGTLLCQILLTFVDELSLEEIEAAFDYMEKLSIATVLQAPELIQYLRR